MRAILRIDQQEKATHQGGLFGYRSSLPETGQSKSIDGDKAAPDDAFLFTSNKNRNGRKRMNRKMRMLPAAVETAEPMPPGARRRG